MTTFSSLKLYGYWRSSSAWRVRIALAHKGLAYENVSVNIAPQASEQFSAAFRSKNAMGQVPVLEMVGGTYGGKLLSQSMAIIELLEELQPTPALLPTDPWQRAQARELAEIVNSGTQPLQNLNVQKKIKELGGDADAWVRDVIAKGLTALETSARSSAGSFLVGPSVTLADVYLVPQMYNARRFGVSLTPFPTLVAVDARCQALPAFATSHPDRMPDAPKPAAQEKK